MLLLNQISDVSIPPHKSKSTDTCLCPVWTHISRKRSHCIGIRRSSLPSTTKETGFCGFWGIKRRTNAPFTSHKDVAAPASLDRRKNTTESSMRSSWNSINSSLYMKTPILLVVHPIYHPHIQASVVWFWRLLWVSSCSSWDPLCQWLVNARHGCTDVR